jgi:hypothetical protein
MINYYLYPPLADPRLVGLAVVLTISTGVADGEAEEVVAEVAEVGTVELTSELEGTSFGLFESGVAAGISVPVAETVAVTVAVTVELVAVVVGLS